MIRGSWICGRWELLDGGAYAYVEVAVDDDEVGTETKASFKRSIEIMFDFPLGR